MRCIRVAVIAFVAASLLAALLTPCPSPDLTATATALAAHGGHGADHSVRAADRATSADHACHGPPPALLPQCPCGCDDAGSGAAVPGAGDALLAARLAPLMPAAERLCAAAAVPRKPAPAFSFDHVPLRA